jgi:hypothetical protein
MICTSFLYEMCDELFASYPVAIANQSDTVSFMVLMVEDGDDSDFFLLKRDSAVSRPVYTLLPWLGGAAVEIDADTGPGVPDDLSSAIKSGVPLPSDGSLFGWRYADVITTLVAIYSDYAPGSPEPCWSLMPLAEIPEARWPPFAGEHLFGPWFWDHYRAGNLVSLGELIAATPGTVFWADTEAILGSECCVVARDVKSGQGYTLPRGRYVHHSVLRMATQLPSLDVLLSGTGNTDLSPRF